MPDNQGAKNMQREKHGWHAKKQAQGGNLHDRGPACKDQGRGDERRLAACGMVQGATDLGIWAEGGMMQKHRVKRVKREALVCCLSCGFSDTAFVLVGADDIINSVTRCPKCSNRAYVCSIQGLFQFMMAATKEIVALKSSVFELEAASDTEER